MRGAVLARRVWLRGVAGRVWPCNKARPLGPPRRAGTERSGRTHWQHARRSAIIPSTAWRTRSFPQPLLATQRTRAVLATSRGPNPSRERLGVTVRGPLNRPPQRKEETRRLLAMRGRRSAHVGALLLLASGAAAQADSAAAAAVPGFMPYESVLSRC